MFQLGHYRHDSFPPVVVTQIKEIQQLLSNIYPLSYEEWEDGFRRDLYPLKQIAYWLILARGCKKFTENKKMNADAKKEVFSTFLERMTYEFDAKSFVEEENLKYLSVEQVQEMLDYFKQQTKERNLPSANPIIVAQMTDDGVEYMQLF